MDFEAPGQIVWVAMITVNDYNDYKTDTLIGQKTVRFIEVTVSQRDFCL